MEYDPHARKRMALRGVTEQAVEYVMQNYDVRNVRTDGRVDYIGRWQGHRLKVVVVEPRNPLYVITVFFLDDA